MDEHFPFGLQRDSADSRSDLFGGVGEVLVWDRTPQNLAPPFQVVLFCRLVTGGRVGPHKQVGVGEIILGYAGSGLCRVDGKEKVISAGVAVSLSDGAVLEIANTGGEPLDYFIIKAVV